MPSTGNEDRRYQLVTHARVRGGNDDQLFVEHNGQKRALMVYDESLFRSEAQKVSERSVRMELAALREYVRGRPQEGEFAGLIGYFEQAIATISDHIAQQKLCPEVPVLLSLPASEYVERMGYSALLGNPWFVAKDVLIVLGFPLVSPNGHPISTTGYLNYLDGTEKQVISQSKAITEGLNLSGVFPARGTRQVTQISESGLYKLVMRSDKPEAKSFQDWVTKDVLPAIRKDGAYIKDEEKVATAHHPSCHNEKLPLSGSQNDAEEEY